MEGEASLLLPVDIQKLKGISFREAWSPDPRTPAGAPSPDCRYRPALCARHRPVSRLVDNFTAGLAQITA